MKQATKPSAALDRAPPRMNRSDAASGCVSLHSGMDNQATRRETRESRLRHLTLGLRTRARHLLNRRRFRMEQLMVRPVVKSEPVGVVHETLGRSPFSQDHGMMLQFDVVIRKTRWHVGLAENGHAIHQRGSFDQYAIDQEGMAWRNEQVALRQLSRERADFDANGQRFGQLSAKCQPASHGPGP